MNFSEALKSSRKMISYSIAKYGLSRVQPASFGHFQVIFISRYQILVATKNHFEIRLKSMLLRIYSVEECDSLLGFIVASFAQHSLIESENGR